MDADTSEPVASFHEFVVVEVGPIEGGAAEKTPAALDNGPVGEGGGRTGEKTEGGNCVNTENFSEQGEVAGCGGTRDGR